MRRTTMTFIGVVLVATILPAAASAKRIYRDRGFYLGLNFAGSFIDQDPAPGSTFFFDENGGGLDLRAGYSFNPVFSLELSLAGANHETSDPAVDLEFGTLRLFAHYRFLPQQQLRPYLKGGIAAYSLRLKEQDFTARATGGGLAFGGGVDYFFTRHFSLGADFTLNVIQYDKNEIQFQGLSVTSDIDEEGSQASIALALTFYF